MKYLNEYSLIDEKVVSKFSNELHTYRKILTKVAKETNYTKPESSIQLPFDKRNIETVLKFVKKYSFVKNIILIGIGGTNLGTKAIYEAFKNTQNLKQILFLDTLDSTKLNFLEKNKLSFAPDNTIVILISQSGKTTESIVNAELVLQILPKLKKNTVIISNSNSILSNFATKNHIDHISIYPVIGGRYSVFSQIGMFPLALCGIDTNHLLNGAKKAVLNGLAEDKNIPFLAAIASFINNNKYFSIHNLFIFEPRLEEVGKWTKQLTAESLGKNTNGITPICTIGSVDLHSIYQLFLQGPKNVYTNFVKVKGSNKLKLSKKIFLKHLVDDIEGKSVEDIYNAIYLGVKKSYQKNSLPYCEYVFEKLNEEELGFFMQSKMLETMYLGYLMKVNAFDQPGVEEYKKETRQILKKS